MNSDKSDQATKSYLSKADIMEMPEAHVSHPFNPNSDVFLKRLAPVFGLERLAMYIARVPPGKESFVYHRHERDEEFLIILSGKGRAEIGKEMFDVGPGDIMGFPAPNGPPHHLTNPSERDLVYLMGGTRPPIDVCTYPKLERRQYRVDGVKEWADLAAFKKV